MNMTIICSFDRSVVSFHIVKIFVCNVDLKKIETCFTIAHPVNLSGEISGG